MDVIRIRKQICPRCKKRKPLTQKYFEPVPSGGFSLVCRGCAWMPQKKRAIPMPELSELELAQLDSLAEKRPIPAPERKIPQNTTVLKPEALIQPGDYVLTVLGWKEVHCGDRYVGYQVGAGDAVRPLARKIEITGCGRFEPCANCTCQQAEEKHENQ